jgi:hypothetical protein
MAGATPHRLRFVVAGLVVPVGVLIVVVVGGDANGATGASLPDKRAAMALALLNASSAEADIVLDLDLDLDFGLID